MENSQFRTSALKPFIQRRLFFGTSIAFLGACLLLYSGLFLSVELLQKIGLPLVIIGFLMIWLGLLPFVRLNRQATAPGTIEVLEKSLKISYPKKKTYIIPLQEIDSISYFETYWSYGITIHLKKEKNPLYFLYFSKRVKEELSEELSNS